MSERIDPEKLGFTLWKGEHYCKGGIKTGKPLIETDFITGEIIEKDEFSLEERLYNYRLSIQTSYLNFALN